MYRRSRRRRIPNPGPFGLLTLVLALLIAFAVARHACQSTVTLTVASKERGSGHSSKYLVWSRGGETFEDSDSYLSFKFDSSDLYGRLQPGHRYRCQVQGWRIPMLSSYRNLLSCEDA